MASSCRFADITAIPTKAEVTAVLWPAYSKASGSISWSVRNAMMPPTAHHRQNQRGHTQGTVLYCITHCVTRLDGRSISWSVRNAMMPPTAHGKA